MIRGYLVLTWLHGSPLGFLGAFQLVEEDPRPPNMKES